MQCRRSACPCIGDRPDTWCLDCTRWHDAAQKLLVRHYFAWAGPVAAAVGLEPQTPSMAIRPGRLGVGFERGFPHLVAAWLDGREGGWLPEDFLRVFGELPVQKLDLYDRPGESVLSVKVRVASPRSWPIAPRWEARIEYWEPAREEIRRQIPTLPAIREARHPINPNETFGQVVWLDSLNMIQIVGGESRQHLADNLARHWRECLRGFAAANSRIAARFAGPGGILETLSHRRRPL